MRRNVTTEPHEHSHSARSTFTTSTLPWLLALAMLALYACTLQHTISYDSLRGISNLNGLIWQTELSAPVTFSLTYPFRWLPGAWIPPAINVFTAVCAALTIA